MKRFDYAIKSLEHQKMAELGKVVIKHYSVNKHYNLAMEESKVKNLNAAIEILKNHPDNKHA